MKTIGFITVVTIIVALELISFSYAPKNTDHQPSINSERDTKYVAPYEIECNVLRPTKEFKIFIKNDKGNYESLIHDIALKTYRHGLYNMVVEKPFGSFHKLRISLTEPLNPIMYEMDENGNTISFDNEHPSGIMPWNEGKIPMTWHNQGPKYKGKKLPGNGSQITVIEIEVIGMLPGTVVSVYPIYAYETIDHSGLSEIIVIAIAVDRKEKRIPDFNVVKRNYSSKLSEIEEWLKDTGRTVVRRVDVPDVYDLIGEKYKEWYNIMKTNRCRLKSLNGLSLKNTTFTNNTHRIGQHNALEIVKSLGWLNQFSMFEAAYKIESYGCETIKEFKIFLKDDEGNYFSLIHDIGYKLYIHGMYNMVVENPRGSIHKLRISLTEPLNPIMYEIDENGNKISIDNEHPRGPMPWNEGKIPMTWHNQGPRYKGKILPGNGSQITVIEIKSRDINIKPGMVILIYPIYAYETIVDHSGLSEIIVIAIAVDREEKSIPNFNVVFSNYSSKFNEINEWLKDTGRTVVRRVDVPDVYDLIGEKYKEWYNIMKTNRYRLKSLNELSLKNTMVTNNRFWISQTEACKIVQSFGSNKFKLSLAPYEIVERNDLKPIREFKIFLKDEKNFVSLVHDIWHKSYIHGMYNMVVESPRYSTHKLRISLTEPLNPIMYEVDEDGNMISFRNEHPSGTMPWNEGKIPMTWHNHGQEYKGKKLPGNGSQITVIEINSIYMKSGDVVLVHPIYAYETRDHSELSEVIAIAIAVDRMYSGVLNFGVVNISYSSELNMIEKWLNATGRTVVNKMDAPGFIDLIEKKHIEWRVLLDTKESMLNSLHGLNLKNTMVPANKWTIKQKEASNIVYRP